MTGMTCTCGQPYFLVFVLGTQQPTLADLQQLLPNYLIVRSTHTHDLNLLFKRNAQGVAVCGRCGARHGLPASAADCTLGYQVRKYTAHAVRAVAPIRLLICL